MKGNIWTVAVVVLFASLFMASPLLAYHDATHSNVVTNESVTVDYSTSVPVDMDAVRYNSSIVARLNGNQLDSGVDYSWNESAGEITWLNSSATSEGDTAYVDYTAETRDQTTQNIGALFSDIDVVYGLIVLMFVLGAAWVVAGGGGGGF